MNVPARIRRRIVRTWRLRPRPFLKRRIGREVSAGLSSDHSPVLVYTMGKVGSATVLRTLQAARITVFHLHFLSARLTAEKRRAAGWGPVPDHLFLGEQLRRRILARPNQRFKIITLVRDPIAVRASSLFHAPGSAPHIRTEDGLIDPARAAEHFTRMVSRSGAFDYVFEWFDRELREVFGIDVFAEPFPRHEGHCVYRAARADTLLIRLEDLSHVGPTTIPRFLGVEGPLALSLDNIRVEKPDGPAYTRFLNLVRLDREICERIYDSPFVRKFYSDEEIAAFVTRWSGRQ